MEHEVNTAAFRNLDYHLPQTALDLRPRILRRFLNYAIAVTELALRVGHALLQLTFLGTQLLGGHPVPLLSQALLHIPPRRLLLLGVIVQLGHALI
jgi:hypothetical protein